MYAVVFCSIFPFLVGLACNLLCLDSGIQDARVISCGNIKDAPLVVYNRGTP